MEILNYAPERPKTCGQRREPNRAPTETMALPMCHDATAFQRGHASRKYSTLILARVLLSPIPVGKCRAPVRAGHA